MSDDLTFYGAGGTLILVLFLAILFQQRAFGDRDDGHIWWVDRNDAIGATFMVFGAFVLVVLVVGSEVAILHSFDVGERSSVTEAWMYLALGWEGYLIVVPFLSKAISNFYAAYEHEKGIDRLNIGGFWKWWLFPISGVMLTVLAVFAVAEMID